MTSYKLMIRFQYKPTSFDQKNTKDNAAVR